jgi:hypothetical protein
MDEHIRKNILFVTFWLIVLKVYIYIYISSMDTFNMSKIVDKVFEMLDAYREED